MARPPRFSYAHAVHHVTLWCNNREFLFEPASFGMFVSLLEETRRRFPLSLFHYCLMATRERLDLHSLYLSLGPDAESRYRAYMALVAEDAAREAVPLAGRYFVGSRRFVARMAKRFGLDGPGSRLEWEEDGPAVVSLAPWARSQ